MSVKISLCMCRGMYSQEEVGSDREVGRLWCHVTGPPGAGRRVELRRRRLPVAEQMRRADPSRVLSDSGSPAERAFT